MHFKAYVVALTVLFAVSLSHAYVELQWVPVDNQGLIPGYDTYDMYLDTDGVWCCSAMVFELEQGSFYQDPYGGEAKENPLLYSFIPTLEFDTYVTEGDYLDTIILPGALDVGGEPYLIFDETILNLSWAPPGGARSTGWIHLARVSFTSDAEGTWIMGTVGSGIPRIDFSGTVADIVIPEPASITLLSLAGGFLLLRR